MTLALTLGMTIGIKKSLWMMAGEVVGVAIVAISAVIGVASLMLNYPAVFSVLKYLGGAYLLYVGIQLWRAKGKMAISLDGESQQAFSRTALLSQGFISAVANPKGWAFTISLLPPFINTELPLVPQLSVLITIILLSELLFMLLYASGGRSLRKILQQGDQVKRLNQIAGTLMIGVAIWLVVG
jgi:threonine/homoserine/homoserine lactone efflux protein